MGEDPDQLRRQIDATRQQMTADVDALTEKVSPRAVVHRRVDRTKNAVTNLRERVMGTASDTASAGGQKLSSAASSVQDTASSAASSVQHGVGSAVSSVQDAAGSATDTARRKAEGNPLAAGLVAFGLGWLVSSLIPASQKEQEAAARVTEVAKENAQPVAEKGKEVAAELAGNLRQPAQEAVESVRSTASDAAGTVKEQARSSAGDVAGSAKDAGQTVRQEASSS